MKYIACFGDSLVQGFPFGNKYSWIAACEENKKLKMLNYGLCGDCCDDIFYRLRQSQLPDYVRYILFLGGANDIISACPYNYTLNMFDKLYKYCEEKNLKLCIVLPLISSDAFLNERLEQLKSDLSKKFTKKVLLLDLQPAIGLDAKTRKDAYLDGVHPKASTYKAMGELARPILEEWTKE
ncbi:MAG: GDSL-type esterase/lipase family protein [Phascolarctobacterium sp.]|nr:GDSL-type esterase/lipase family protein [Phascolarctobacterium sp.]